MIDIEDVLVLSGMGALLAVAFHLGLWASIVGIGVLLIIGGLVLGRFKAQRKGKK